VWNWIRESSDVILWFEEHSECLIVPKGSKEIESMNVKIMIYLNKKE
jgi:hypothetical protein